METKLSGANIRQELMKRMQNNANAPKSPQLPNKSPIKKPIKQINKTVNRPNVWSQLEKNAQFMTAFNNYNRSAGNAFARLKQQKHEVKGREKEADKLLDIMERPLTPVAVLLARAGVGKSALVEDFVKRVDNNQLHTVEGRRYFVVSLRVGYLKALGNDKLQSVLTGMLDELYKLETLARQVLNDDGIRIILFIDEMHMLVTIFGPGTKIGGDLMKDILARCPIRVITATTRREYDSTVAVDEPFKERFKEIELNELPKPILMEICENWWLSNAPDLPLPHPDIFSKILDANAFYRSSSAEPRKTLDILEDVVSRKRRYPNQPITLATISEIFNTRFHIKLDLEFDADRIFENVRSRVRGQGLALFELQRALRTVAFQINPMSNKPIMTLLFSGPTGVGKALLASDVTPTTKGFKQNKDIQLGDYLFDRNGKPTKVIGRFPQGSRNLYRLELQDGRSIVTDENHLFSYYTLKQVQKGNLDDQPLTTKTVKELLKTSYITTNDFDEIIPNCYIPLNKPVNYESKNYDIQPYDLGLSYYDKQSNNTTIFENYKIGSISQRWQLIKGLFDANGHIEVTSDGYVLSLTDDRYDLLKDVQEVLYSLGIHSKIENNQVNHTLFVGCQNDQLNQFFNQHDKLLMINNIINLNINNAIETYKAVGITSIIDLNKKDETICFLVDNDEHLFQTTRQYIVTHNTETVKAISDVLYPGENVLYNMNMPDYKDERLEPEFRKRLGERVRHVPNSIILLDEFEKGSSALIDSMLAILDEGVVHFEVTNREGQVEQHSQSLRNTIIIATTNAGHEVFQNFAQFAQDNDGFSLNVQSKAEYEQLKASLLSFLKKSGFKPEMLGRFNRIIPYRNLTEKVLIDIADACINNLAHKFKTNKDIELTFPVRNNWPVVGGGYANSTDVAAFIATIRSKADDSTMGGARAINRAIDQSLQDELIDYIIDHPGSTKFEVTVSRDSRLYDRGAGSSEGGIVVNALN